MFLRFTLQALACALWAGATSAQAGVAASTNLQARYSDGIFENASGEISTADRFASVYCVSCEAVSEYHGNVTIGKPIMSSPDEPMYYEYSYAGTTTSSAIASASYGALKAAGEVKSVSVKQHVVTQLDGSPYEYDTFSPFYTTSSALASFTDTLVINSEKHDGETGHIRFKASFSWKQQGQFEASKVEFLLAALEHGSSNYMSSTYMAEGRSIDPASGESQPFSMGQQVIQGVSTDIAFDQEHFYLDVWFTFGTAFDIQAYLGASLTVLTTQPDLLASGLLDAGHSAYWEGVSFVEDASGQAITDFSLQSESGTDWTRDFRPASNVPEPGTTLLTLAGLGIATLAARRRQQPRLDEQTSH